MEFFRTIRSKTTEKELQRQLDLPNLDRISSELFILHKVDQKEANIGGIWGEFTLSRMEIKGGVRFSLLECPNALCWTITTGYPPDPDSIIIHLTINRLEKEQEFIEEISDFLDDICINLKHFFSTENIAKDIK